MQQQFLDPHIGEPPDDYPPAVAKLERQIARWLVRDARALGDAPAIVDGFCRRISEGGVPLSRVRVGQSLKNPLLAAWGVLWTPDTGAEVYTVARRVMDTAAWEGSPFQTAIMDERPVRQRLDNLVQGRDHTAYFDAAAGGGTDYLALPIRYGDGSRQGWSFVTDAEGGFEPAGILLLTRLADALAAALEPIAMRRSTASLLQTYLGRGPASGVVDGQFRRGDHTVIEAAILLTDLRAYTLLADTAPPPVVLHKLGAYFDAVVEAVYQHGGDVLKFVGDGVLAVWPIDDPADAGRICRAAQHASIAARATLAASEPDLAFVAVLHCGTVAYGNIGSPDRLDFTIIGPAVNLAARLEMLGKQLDEPCVASADFVTAAALEARSLGRHQLRGVAQLVELFRPLHAPPDVAACP